MNSEVGDRNAGWGGRHGARGSRVDRRSGTVTEIQRFDTFHDSYRQPRALETGLRMAPRQESTKSGLVGRTSKLDRPHLVETPGHTYS